MTLRQRRLRTLTAAAVAFAAFGDMVGPGSDVARAQQAPGTSGAPGAASPGAQSGVGDTGNANSQAIPANPASQTGQNPMQNQNNAGSAASGAADASPGAGVSTTKQLPPLPGQSAGQEGTGRTVGGDPAAGTTPGAPAPRQ